MRDWTDTEVQVLVDVCSRLGCTVRALVGVMANESGCSPSAHNPGGAVGLIQFEPDTLRDLGWNEGTSAFALTDVIFQLGYVERYYSIGSRKPYMGLSDTAAYVGAFLPAYMPHADDPAYILCGDDGPIRWAYLANRGFDVEHNGSISIGDLQRAADKAIASSPVAQSILARACQTIVPTSNPA